MFQKSETSSRHSVFNSFKKVKENSKPFSNMRLNRTDYAAWHKDGNVYTTLVRTIGIKPENVTVELHNNVIRVEGYSTWHGDEYSTGFDIPLSDEFLSHLINIEHETANGLTLIRVTLN